MSYMFYNANPESNDIWDCSVRALSKALDINWEAAYTILSDYARERGLMLDSVESIEGFLDDNFERFCDLNMTLEEFANTYNRGIFLVTMPGHITVVEDGVIYDSFDCSDRFIWCSWLVE